VAKDLGGFLSLLKEKYPNELRTVSRPIQPAKFEVTGLLENINRAKQYPSVLFNNPADVYGQPSGIKLVSNIFANRERCALAFDMKPEDYKMPLSLEYARREKLITPPELINGPAPVQEVVFTGKEIDVAKLPIAIHHEMDMGPVLTMTLCMKDPDTGVYDISFIKGFYKGKPDYMGVSIHTPHLQRILRKYTAMNKPAPAIFILGHHPAFYLGSLALIPYERDDYEAMGGFMGEPLRLAPSVTWGEDFLVPADAEIIIEGEIIPGVREVVDPFGEVTRHYQAQCIRQAMQVKAVTRRQEAIMQDIFAGHEGHWNLGAIPKEGSVFNTVQSKVGNVKAVCMPHSGIGRLACYVSMKKVNDGQPKQAALVALNESWTFQTVVVVDEDIDVFNEQEVMWALNTRVDPLRDVTLIKNVGRTVFDTAMAYNKLVIDATKPLDRPFPCVIKVPEAAVASMKPDQWLD
jgi:UbiD family decarboxylase